MRIILVVLGCALAHGSSAIAADDPGGSTVDIAALKAEIEQLRSLTASQSHAMIDVEYHFANLWFAGKAANWSLATFYLNETRARVQWALRIRPSRKLASGQDLDLKPLGDAFEEAGIAPLRAALDARDPKAFEAAYRRALSQCLACHVAAEKPFLRPGIPVRPASPMMDTAN